jgi:ATP-binding cassette subfamily G (WHITE) protein 2 (SNQ2)
MAKEFYNLELQCVPPNLVPLRALGGSANHQSCTLAGSKPDSTTVNGANYILTAFTYKRSHLWRNFGILCAFFLFFLALTMYGMESAKPNSG